MSGKHEKDSGIKDVNVYYTRQEPISVPSPLQERRIAIRYHDWARCKNKLKKIRSRIPRIHLLYSFLFGITASSLFSLVAFYTSPQTQYPEWIYPLYWLLMIFSLVTASGFVFVDKRMLAEKDTVMDEVIEDMEGIEKTFAENQ